MKRKTSQGMERIKDRLQIRRPNLRVGWLISYVAVFALPLAAYLVMVFFSVGTIRGQIQDVNESTLEMLSLAVDNQVQTINAMASEITANAKLTEILWMEKKGENTSYKVYELQKTLSSMVSRNPLIEQIYIYIYDGDYIVSNSTKASPFFFYQGQCEAYALNYQEWKNILQSPQRRQYDCWPGTGARPVPVLLTSIPIFGGEPQAMLCIELAPMRFWQVVEGYEEMSVTIRTGSGTVVYQGPKSGRGATLVRESDETLWRYEANVQDAILAAQTGVAPALMGLGVILLILVGFGIIRISMRRNYYPIHTMITRFEQVLEKRGDTHELPYIENALNSLIIQLKDDRAQMDAHMELIEQAYLICFLMGSIPQDVSVEKELRRMGFDDRMRFSVLILDGCGSLTVDQARELLAIGDAESCLYFGRGVELGGQIVFVIDRESGDEESRQKVQERLLEQYPHARLAWSAAYDGGQNLNYAYKEARYVLLSAPKNSAGVLTMAWLQEQETAKIQIPPALKGALTNAVQNGDEAAVDDVIEQIWRANAQESVLSLTGVKLLATVIYNYVLDLRKTSALSFSQTEMQTFHNIQVRDTEAQQVLDDLKSAVRRIASQMSGEGIGREEQLVLRMKAYIDTHYSDVLLNVESLCQAFERSPSSVNRSFREVTGHGPLHYINFRRVQEAKRLFVESGGSYSASEVLKRVGYTNLNTFTRVFKRYEGITPGQYKDTVWQTKHPEA